MRLIDASGRDLRSGQTMKYLHHEVSQFLWAECRGDSRDICCRHNPEGHFLADVGNTIRC